MSFLSRPPRNTLASKLQGNMLEIFISNQKVDLPTDIQIALTIENPFMLQDRVPAPYSLAFTLPPTQRNLKVFAFPNRIASYRSVQSLTVTRPCRILFQSVTIATGIINLTEYNQGIKAAFKGADLTDTMRASIYETPMHSYVFATPNWRDIDFDNPLNYAGRYRQRALDAANGLDERMVVAPIKTETDNVPLQFVQRLEAFNTGEFYNSIRFPQRMMDTEYINYYNPDNQEFALRAVDPPDRGEPFAIVHAPIFPLLRVHYIFSMLFGSALKNNIFADPELEDLVIPSTYFHNYVYAGNRRVVYNGPGGMMFNNKAPFEYNPLLPPGTPTDPFYRLNDFLPASAGPDLLKELLKIFCASMVIKGGGFDLRFNKDIVAAPVSTNWDSKLIGRPILSSRVKKVYKYGYDGEEQYIPDETSVTVPDIHAMIADPLEPDPGEELTMVYQISGSGQFYERHAFTVEGEGSEPDVTYYSYKLLDGGYGKSFDTEKETYDAVSRLKPMPVLPKEYWWTAENDIEDHPQLDWWTVPFFGGDRGARPDQAYLMFFRGMVSSMHTGHSYPYLSPYTVAPDGSSVGTKSLSWQGSAGLLQNYHLGFKNWIEQDKVRVNGAFLLTPLDLHNLDITSKVHLQGRNFYIDRIQVNIRHNRIDPAVIDLVEV